MSTLDKNKFSVASSLLSLIVLICVVIINYHILDDYKKSDAKTKAFFDALTFTKYSFKYYLIIFLLASFILICLGFKKNEKISHLIVSIILLFISILSIFFNFWKLFT